MLNLEPGADLVLLGEHDFVAALTSFDSEALRDSADLLLPMCTFAETSGTYVNVAGTWQSFAGVASPVGDARPAWKVLRVLGNLLDADGFEYVSSEDVRDEFAAAVSEVAPSNDIQSQAKHAAPNGADAVADQIDVSIYTVDGVVRRAAALQMTAEAKRSKVADE
jgi:NADH-quinone oxidoreductase subunit G